MPNLRSREIPSSSPPQRNPPNPSDTTSPTPLPVAESLSPSPTSGPVRRRSTRFFAATELSPSPKRIRQDDNGNSPNFNQEKDGSDSSRVRVRVRVPDDNFKSMIDGVIEDFSKRYVQARLQNSQNIINSGNGDEITSPKRYSREEKGKSALSVDNKTDDQIVWNRWMEEQMSKLEERCRNVGGAKGKGKLSVDDKGDGIRKMEDKWSDLRSPRRYTREEKGKGIASAVNVVIDGNGDDIVSDSDDDGLNTVNLELGLGLGIGVKVEESDGLGGEMNIGNGPNYVFDKQQHMKEQHKNIARRNALKYAHFNVEEGEGQEEEQEDEENPEEEIEMPQGNIEDWPGPFSTAMKIIKDREKNKGSVGNESGLSKRGMSLISWTPKGDWGPEGKKRHFPSLLNMCLKVLSQNVDAIASLNYVADVLRHKLCQVLCDSRKMNAHFFSLLLEGSPAEIRVADCSWLEEEDFESSVKDCDTSKLTVLQLDLCGQCISDASLLKAVVPKGLPVLSTISLKGACRISDKGLAALVSAAPLLRSMNLSQCSLLTDVGIKSIADSLGSILHELYLDNCDTLDAMRILPSLQKLVNLEILSLKGMGSVSDKFIRAFIKSNGWNIKELDLANCVNLTDNSLKVISETCPQLHVLDISYLKKLTDIGMAYLANGCSGIHHLRLCLNAFSDEAIAAFLEASGGSLIELSLNNIKKVGQNTTLSIARQCKNLVSLDLSWCRSLTDEAMGLIADNCLSLRLLKIFGCTQITKTFAEGHSNPDLHVVGMNLTPILEHIKRPDFQQGALHHCAVP